MSFWGDVWAAGIVVAAAGDTARFVFVWGSLLGLSVISLVAFKWQRKWLNVVLLVQTALILFILRDTTFLFGDSRLWISAVQQASWSAPSLHSPAYGLLVRGIGEAFRGHGGVVLIALTSVLCGLGAILILGGSLGRNKGGLPLGLVLLICQPLAFIFFGHIEPYALLGLLTAFILVRARKDIADGRLTIGTWGLVLIGCLAHYSALLIALAFLSWSFSQGSMKRLVLIYAILMFLVMACLIYFPSLRPLSPFGQNLDGPGRTDYLIDILNIWALCLIPGLVLFLRVRSEAMADEFGPTLALIVITYALFPVLAYFELGGLRDLDLMASLGVAWAFLLGIGVVRSERPLSRPLLLTGGLGSLALAGIIVTTTGARGSDVMKPQLERKAMSMSSKAYGYEILANYEEDRGNLREAEEHLRKAIETIPGNLRVYGALGEIQLERGDTTGALKSLRTAMKSDRAARTGPLLGELLVRRNQLEEALEVLLDMGPALYGSQRASATLCVAYSKLGMPDSSLAVAERRIKWNAKDALAHMNAASGLVRLGEPGQAIEHLRLAVAIDPDNKTYRMRLVDLLRSEPGGEIRAREYLEGLDKQ